jgi:hypothetical protein
MEHTKTYAEQDSTMIAHHETDAPQNLQVCYSGMDNGRFVLGDETITATSAHTMQIHGDCPVNPGMELALMVAIPHSDDHLYLVGGQVSAATWSCFEVDIRQTPEALRAQLELIEKTATQNRPRSAMQGNRAISQPNKRPCARWTNSLTVTRPQRPSRRERIRL